MTERNRLTYYFTGKAIIKTFATSTSIPDDMDWMALNPENSVVGSHFNKSWWKLNPEIVKVSKLDIVEQMKHMNFISDDHELVQLIQMHVLIGAVPKPEDE